MSGPFEEVLLNFLLGSAVRAVFLSSFSLCKSLFLSPVHFKSTEKLLLH